MIESVTRLLERHASLIAEISPELDEEARERYLPDAEAEIEGARTAVATLTALVEADDAGTVYWIEDDPNKGPTFHARPLELSRARWGRDWSRGVR